MGKFIFLLNIFICCFLLKMEAQSGYSNLGGAHFLSLGRAGLALEGIESIYNNQAGLSEIKNIAFDVSVERRFNLEELSTICVAGAKKFNFGTFGLMFSQFGTTHYNEQKLGLAYARLLNKNLSLGGQFNMLGLNEETIGSRKFFTFEIGVNLKVSSQFTVSTHLFSPAQVALTDQTTLGSRFRLGMKYMPSKKLFLMIELDKLIDRADLEYKLGLGYQVANKIQLRTGANLTTSSFGFGLVVEILEKTKVIGATGSHQFLGLSPAMSLKYGE